jgi:hypothetical protein
LSDGLGERGKPGDRGHQRERVVATESGGCSQQTRGSAQAVPCWRGARNPAVRGAGGTIIAVGSLAEYPAAEGGSDGMHRVRGSPGGVGRSGRTRGGVGTDLRGRISSGLGGELP